MLNKIFMLMICLSLSIITGCASMKHNYTPEIAQTDTPKLNEESTAYVGESMLSKGTTVMYDVLKVNSPVDGACYDIPAGIYPKTGSDSSKQYFSIHGDNVEVDRSGLCDPMNGMYVPNNNQNEICVITIFGGVSCYKAHAEIKKLSIPSRKYMQSSLIFSGKNGNEIELLYTERSDTQTVYSHNIRYDLSKTDTIGYRGARIKILSCSNESIRYIVLQKFPDRDKRILQ